MMHTITAWQHIYSNVERDRSPTKTAGFQTLFYSHDGLDQRDVEAIEERVFYVFGGINPVKRVFFHLPSNKVAMGIIQPIEGKDAAGRAGRYLAHTLIVSQTDLEATQINPLHLFSSDLFMTSLEQAFVKGDTSGNIKPVDIQLLQQYTTTTVQIGGELGYVRALVQFAANYKLFEENQTALALIGSTNIAEQTLATIFDLLPAQISSQCTFDSFFERGGKLNFTYYWCAGFHDTPHQPIYAIVDVDQQTITDLDNYATPSTALGRWIDDLLAANKQAYIIKHKQEAFALGNFIDRPTAELNNINLANEQLLLSMLNANKQVVQDQIRERACRVLPEVLAEKIISPVIAHLSPTETITALSEGFSAAYLLAQLFSVYKTAGFKTPAKEERQALAELLKSHQHQQLAGLSLVWGGASWENPITRWRIKGGIEAMDEQTYKGFWDLAVPAKLVEPMDLLVDGKEAAFTSLIARDQLLDADELPGLLKTLIKTGQHASIDLLTPLVQNLNKQQIKKINKLIKSATTIPDSFANAISRISD